MVALFNDEFLSREIAMRGGTVLHKVHLAPAARYSEDIDFVAMGARPEQHIRAGLMRVLLPILGKHATDVIASVKLTVRNVLKPSRIIRLEYRWPSVTTPGHKLKVKFEVNTTERKPHVPVVKMPFSVGLRGRVRHADVASYDVNEMLGTKMRALFQRKQGRDLFDLYWALTGPAAIPPDPRKVVAAFQHYMRAEGSRISRQDFYEALDERIADPDFRYDMPALLRQGISYDVDVICPEAKHDSLRSILRRTLCSESADREHDFHPLRTCDRNQFTKPGAHPRSARDHRRTALSVHSCHL